VTLIIPYCMECHRHAAARGTRLLALGLASGLLSLTAMVTLPLAVEWISYAFYLPAIALTAALPIALGACLAPGPGKLPHTPGRAAWWQKDGTLACTRAAWAARVAKLNGGSVQAASLQERLWSPWSVAVPIAALVASPFVLDYLRPEVRVLNLTEQRLELRADGQSLGFVEPSSTESASAGVDVRIPAGWRGLEARTLDGKRIGKTRVWVQAGRQHLYAPGSGDYCFWLESTSYGRQVGKTRLEPLEGKGRFWTLPRSVDTWFAPNPPAASADALSTGGVLVALRQGRCADAPLPTPSGGGSVDTRDLAGDGHGL
jgi:hypothetical protein